MHRTYQVHSPPSPPSFPSRQNKVVMQRQYREKEGECFNMLRDVIRELTGEELQTRQEILRKAIDLLLTVSEIRRQRETQVVPPVPYENLSLTNPADTTLAQADLGYSAQSSHWPQTWQFNAGFDAQSAYYTAQSRGQQYHSMSNMDSALAPASYQEYGEDWSHYPQL